MDGSMWFAPDQNMAAQAMVEVMRNYTYWKKKANASARRNKEQFSYKKIQKKTADLFHKYVPKFDPPAKMVELNLPTLDGPRGSSEQLSDSGPTGMSDVLINLPKLKVPEMPVVDDVHNSLPDEVEHEVNVPV